MVTVEAHDDVLYVSIAIEGRGFPLALQVWKSNCGSSLAPQGMLRHSACTAYGNASFTGGERWRHGTAVSSQDKPSWCLSVG